jgi:hypothetical protein
MSNYLTKSLMRDAMECIEKGVYDPEVVSDIKKWLETNNVQFPSASILPSNYKLKEGVISRTRSDIVEDNFDNSIVIEVNSGLNYRVTNTSVNEDIFSLYK